ncbi:MAG: 60S ribosomal protein L28 [Cirrosporium novae-zelandiae]|nr:MAG: 60S ribosomal protein L28 [Cirrosporium novae-zelandiae]
MPTRYTQTRKHRWKAPQACKISGDSECLEDSSKLITLPYSSPVVGDHHRTNLDKYHPGYFGKVGMRYFHKLHNQFWKPTINIEKLWTLLPVEQRDAYLTGKKTDTAPVLDLLPLGYSKVLGKGRLPEIPIVVKARFFSAEAEKKIKGAGGRVVLVA